MTIDNTQRKWNIFSYNIVESKKICLRKSFRQKNKILFIKREKTPVCPAKRPRQKAFVWSRLTHDDDMILGARTAKREPAASEFPRPLKGLKLLRSRLLFRSPG